MAFIPRRSRLGPDMRPTLVLPGTAAPRPQNEPHGGIATAGSLTTSCHSRRINLAAWEPAPHYLPCMSGKVLPPAGTDGEAGDRWTCFPLPPFPAGAPAGSP